MVGVWKSSNPGDKVEGSHNHGKGKGNNTLQKDKVNAIMEREKKITLFKRTKDKENAIHKEIFLPHS